MSENDGTDPRRGAEPPPKSTDLIAKHTPPPAAPRRGGDAGEDGTTAGEPATTPGAPPAGGATAGRPATPPPARPDTGAATGRPANAPGTRRDDAPASGRPVTAPGVRPDGGAAGRRGRRGARRAGPGGAGKAGAGPRHGGGTPGRAQGTPAANGEAAARRRGPGRRGAAGEYPDGSGGRSRGGSGGGPRRDREERRRAEPGGRSRGRAVLRVTAIAGLPVLLPIVLLLVLVMIILGVVAAGDGPQVQPGDGSDTTAAPYVPGGWLPLLKAAAGTTSGQPAYAAVPWTILAGIVQVQSDYGRYSPYDDIDRDPGRASTVIGAGTTTIGTTTGAGPGPVTGVTGPGETATPAAGHDGPPPGDLSHQLGWYLWALRTHESLGDYHAPSPKGSDACGAYQYLTSTWNKYGGYATACDAPASVQDRREIEDTLTLWQRFHSWQEVIAYHLYPLWAADTAQWHRCPEDRCDINPTLWDYVDDVIGKMGTAALSHPATQTVPAAYRIPLAGGCQVAAPAPAIGGKSGQGVGPYLLTPAAAADLRGQGKDPGDPCDASVYVAGKLADAARRLAADPAAPPWRPDGTATDMANARAYWSRVIDLAAVFMDRSADPGRPCALPPESTGKPYSVSFKIIYIWRCEIGRLPALYLVTAVRSEGGTAGYTVETDLSAATERLVAEALSVSYGAGGWKTAGCDNRKATRQGVFPMTRTEAAAAGVTDRCDVAADIDGAARLVLSTEQVPPDRRAHDLGAYQPMAGGWQNLSVALGADLQPFSTVGPGEEFTASAACAQVMTAFLTALAPVGPDFATLREPPAPADLDAWRTRLTTLVRTGHLTDPEYAKECAAGSWGPGFNSTLAQFAADLAGTGTPYTATLDGIGNYYLAREKALAPIDPVAGRDSLVVPRLAPRPLNEVAAPIAADATGVWSKLGSAGGVAVPLDRLAVEYAWFLGGVIAPFDSVGKLIGSLKDASTAGAAPGTAQQMIGADGCPTGAPAGTLRAGSDQIGIHRLCVDSVAAARTPEAAIAIKWALSHLGWPYSQSRRNDAGYADCSSFVSRAYRDGGALPNLYRGNAPTTDTIRAARWMRQVPLSLAQPGDLVEPHSGHVAMLLADGYMTHTNLPGDVSKVERAYTAAYWAGTVVPGAAP